MIYPCDLDPIGECPFGYRCCDFCPGYLEEIYSEEDDK